MKVNVAKRLVESEGFDTAPKQFAIKQNARAFEILSSNIYSNKPRALLREYGCNAYDSHVAAGKEDVPFVVHLPNTFEPYLEIQDFGLGLSDDQVMTLYTTYFESTKADSDDFIGCMGLGSKSAFAYTDQFTVTSIFNGEKNTYTAYVDESGAPSITKMMTEQTSEVNGVSIQIPVKDNDFRIFRDEAMSVFYRFKTQPIFTGENVTLPKVEYTLETPLYKMRSTTGDGSYVIQGAVAYPLDTSAIQDLSIELRNLTKAPFDIIVPMGQCNITASREHLNYDKRTQENLKTILSSIQKDFKEKIKKSVEECKTYFEASRLYFKLNNTIDYSVKQSIDFSSIKYKGESLTPSYPIGTRVATILPPEKNPDGTDKIPEVVYTTWAETQLYSGWDLRQHKQPSCRHESSFDIRPSTTRSYKYVIYNEYLEGKKPVKVSKTMKLNFDDRDIEKVYFINIKHPDGWEEIKKQLRGFPEDSFIQFSDLKVPPVEKRDPSVNKKGVKLEKSVIAVTAEPFTPYYCHNGRISVRETYKVIDVEQSKAAIYVLCYSKNVIKEESLKLIKSNKLSKGDTPDTEYNYLDSDLELLMKLKYFKFIPEDTPVYVVNYQDRADFINNPKFVSHHEVLNHVTKRVKTDKELMKVMKSLNTFEKNTETAYLVSTITHSMDNNNPLLGYMTNNPSTVLTKTMKYHLAHFDVVNDYVSKIGLDDTPWKSAVKDYQRVRTRESTLAAQKLMVDFFYTTFRNLAFNRIKPKDLDGAKFFGISESKTSETLENKLLQSYPLISILNKTYMDTKGMLELLHYVKLCDKSKKLVAEYHQTIEQEK